MALEDAGWAPPSHVDPKLAVAGNIWAEMGDRPHDRLVEIAAGRPVLYLQTHHIPGHSPNGTWSIVSAGLAREVLLDTETFTSVNTTSLSNLLGGLDIIPIEVDPPAHGKYRALIAEFFKPKAVNLLREAITEQADALIDSFIDEGGCEFVEQFGKVLPASIFLSFFGLPKEQTARFLALSNRMMSSPSPEERVQSMRDIRDLLADELEARRTSPRDDVLSALAHGEIDGRPLTQNESLGGAMLLFIAGLDTVAALLGWIFRHLAENPEMQAQLRSDRSGLSAAIEEFLRYYSSVTMTRRATRDVEFAGASIKAGETVICPSTLFSRDPDEFEDAGAFDLAKGKRRHLAFGFGAHICIGMHLARLELSIALERWLDRAPPFVPAGPTTSHGGAVLALDTLSLRWA